MKLVQAWIRCCSYSVNGSPIDTQELLDELSAAGKKSLAAIQDPQDQRGSRELILTLNENNLLCMCLVIFIIFTLSLLEFEVHGFIKCSHFEICQHFWSASIIVVQEIFRHYWCAGKFPALVKCRKFSSICEVQEIFLHWWSALLSWNFPALVKCRKFSGIFSWNFPALVKCRKFSGIFSWNFPALLVFVQKIFLHFLYSGNFPAFLLFTRHIKHAIRAVLSLFHIHFTVFSVFL